MLTEVKKMLLKLTYKLVRDNIIPKWSQWETKVIITIFHFSLNIPFKVMELLHFKKKMLIPPILEINQEEGNLHLNIFKPSKNN